MATFLANNLIAGKKSWSSIEGSKIYAKYIADVLTILEMKGYMIDDDGNCVPTPKED